MDKLAPLIYRILLTLLLPFALLRLFWRNRHYPVAQSRWRERLGFYETPRQLKQTIWLHAVSVGEANAAEPLIARLLLSFPDHQLVVTTTTATGAQTVEGRYKGSVSHAYFPFDLNFCINGFLTHYKPCLVLLMETELWPNLVANCSAKSLPILLVNGRMSERAAKRYRYLPTLTRLMMSKIDFLAVQSEADAQRFVQLGTDPANVVVTGSIKFDRELTPSVFERGEAIRRRMGVNRLVIMAGSTRDGEEEILIRAYLRLRETSSSVLMVIAPRHPERFSIVHELLNKHQLKTVKYSDDMNVSSEIDVFLLDAMGELANYYAAADLAFVGGSIADFGGHNTLEPAGLGVPILVGPHTYNFTEINNKLRHAGALIEISNEHDFVSQVTPLLSDSNRRDEMGQAARGVFEANRGALEVVMGLISEKLPLQKL